MNSQREITVALQHLTHARLHIGYLTWLLTLSEQDGGFHALSPEQSRQLSDSFTTAARFLLKSGQIVADLNHFKATTERYTSDSPRLCGCEQHPAEWILHVTIGARGRPDKLYLCTKCLLESE